MKKSSAIRKLENKAEQGNIKAAFQMHKNYVDGRSIDADISLADKYANQTLKLLKNHTFNIISIKLTDFRAFSDTELQLLQNKQNKEKLNIIVGINGAGKTTFLDAIAKSLSWLIRRIVSPEGSGSGDKIDELDIRINSEYASIFTRFSITEKTQYEIELSKAITGSQTSRKNNIIEISQLGELYKFAYKNDSNFSFPIMAYYTVDRSLDINKKDQEYLQQMGENENQFNGYTKALQGTADFRSFIKWFKECEETEKFHSGAIQKQARKSIDLTLKVIQSFMPEIDNIQIQRSPKPFDMLLNKDGITLSVLQLSQGEKSLLALITDILHRLILLNPSLEDPLQGNGIVLIDEIDLHLHPSWQQKVVPALLRTFPNIQFVLTTHSPQVLSTIKSEHIHILKNGEIYGAPQGTKGAESSRILKRVQNVEVRPPDDENTKLLNQYLDLVYKDKWKTSEAIQKRQELNAIYGDEELELTKADLYIENREWELEFEKD